MMICGLLWAYSAFAVVMQINADDNESFKVRKSPIRVAIVGGGIGGASCAYWLRKSTNQTMLIHLYNDGPIGGRIATIEIGGKLYESGASVLHPDNVYMRNWLDEFSLKKHDSEHIFGRTGIWNGHAFVFEESAWSWDLFLN